MLLTRPSVFTDEVLAFICLRTIWFDLVPPSKKLSFMCGRVSNTPFVLLFFHKENKVKKHTLTLRPFFPLHTNFGLWFWSVTLPFTHWQKQNKFQQSKKEKTTVSIKASFFFQDYKTLVCVACAPALPPLTPSAAVYMEEHSRKKNKCPLSRYATLFLLFVRTERDTEQTLDIISSCIYHKHKVNKRKHENDSRNKNKNKTERLE